jgi:hypothetical protein
VLKSCVETTKSLNIREMPTIQASYVGMTEGDARDLRYALAAICVDTYAAFWKGCLNSLIAQSKSGELIAWPPSFALQDRNPEFVRLKLELTRHNLQELDRIKEEAERQSSGLRSRKTKKKAKKSD